MSRSASAPALDLLAKLYKNDGIASAMEIVLVEKTADSATIAFKDANLTLITPLMKALDEDDSVDSVRFIETHPELEARKLFVKVKEGDPLAAINRASQSVADYYSKITE